jgi:deazaflavin-dependent oxidoreductase (nitroreductase family)
MGMNMIKVDEINEKKVRQIFKIFNRFMILLWKLGLADWLNLWPSVFGQFMVITHIGRKSGFKRLTPVNYAVIDGEIYCCAGFGKGSDWYQNILANPTVEVWLTEGRWIGEAKDVSSNPNFLPIIREVLRCSGFAAPLFGVDPKKLNDTQLAQITAEYKLVHITRLDEKTGRDGPGELAWIWPLIAVILLLVKRRRVNKK